jgi:hypothetical protein
MSPESRARSACWAVRSIPSITAICGRRWNCWKPWNWARSASCPAGFRSIARRRRSPPNSGWIWCGWPRPAAGFRGGRPGTAPGRGRPTWWIRWPRCARRSARVPLCLIVGTDAFRELHTWRRWRELTDLAHIVVMQRPGPSQPLPPPLDAFVAPRVIHDPLALRQRPAGGILFQPSPSWISPPPEFVPCWRAASRLAICLPEAVLARILDGELYRLPPSPPPPAT